MSLKYRALNSGANSSFMGWQHSFVPFAPSVQASSHFLQRTWLFNLEPQAAGDELADENNVPENLAESAGIETYRRNLDAIEARLPESERLILARQRVEAILFLSREPLSSRKIAQLACLADATQARTLTRQLNDLYREESQAFQIEETSGGYLLLTRPQFSKWLRKLDHVPGDIRLGMPALETLTIIAYRQPVVRAYIESVRGANCDETLRQLLERDLIRIAGRSEELGRPYLYGTTKRFLQMFGLRSVDHLPKREWVLQTDLQLANPALDDSIHGT